VKRFINEQRVSIPGVGLVTFEAGKSPKPYPSTLGNCRKLSVINWLLKCGYLDNWVANHRSILTFSFKIKINSCKKCYYIKVKFGALVARLIDIVTTGHRVGEFCRSLPFNTN
jgi:hypothetical protein